MAFIASTAFEPRITNHEYDSLANITGIYNNSSSQPEICPAGLLCVRGDLIENEGYTDITNSNTWVMTAAPSTALASTGIYACNTFGVNELADPVTGAIYKVGSNTLGLAVPAGVRSTFTRIYFDGQHMYRFGIGNLSTTISSNTFFTINNGLLVPAAAAPSTTNGTPYFELVDSGTFTQGAYAGFTYYDVFAYTTVVGTSA